MILIIDFGSSKVPQVERIVNSLGVQTACYKWDKFDEDKINSFSGIILSGAPVLLTKINPDIYLSKFSFIKKLPIPILGICFGHQLLGMLYGAKFFLGNEKRNPINVKLLAEDALFKGLEEEPVFLEDHTEGIDLPPGFICLAKSKDYEVEAMKHISKPFYGVQFHPEVSGKNGEILLRNFCGMTM